MSRGMYRFDPDDAFNFAREIHATTRQRGNELQFQECPYCHARNRDDQYKFSINLTNGKFQCMRASCGIHGNMITLSKDFDFSLGGEIDEYYRPSKQYRRPKQPKEPIKPKDAAVEYLKSRGIPEKITQKYEITTEKGNDNILMFPFFDDQGVLEFIKIRDMDFQKGVSSWKEKAFQKDMKPILFGMKQCEDFGRLVITEGQLDSLSVATAGIENAVSVPMGVNGWTWVPYCWDWVQKFQEIVVFGDYENGHITLLDELETRFKGKVKHVKEEDYQGCKDANELLQKHGIEAVRQAVENAISPPVNNVISLAQVKRANIYDTEKLKTGISKLDELLCGGLPFGSVVLIGGKRGEGKSTFASQIMLNAVDQGYITMTYSGEMRNEDYRNWFDFQAAGPEHIITSSGRPDITKENGDLLAEWYDGRAYVYDNTICEDEERTSVLETIRSTIMRYGARVILVDNLMTAMYDEPSEEKNKNDREGWFVQQLTKIALEFNVLIILVAHMRKNGNGDDNDDVLGASEITNLVSVTISYSRDKKIGVDQRRLKVSKNRLFGKIDTDGFALDYDENSKRIYGMGDDLYKHYGWESLDFIPSEDENTPFDERANSDDDWDPMEFLWEDENDEE